MEKPNKPKNLFLKFLPKAASAVTFQNPPYSPGRDHHHHHHHSSTKLKAHAYKGFSGPLNFDALPDEARERPKNGGYDTQEPTSPKVSCMGQIKYKHKKNKLIKAATKNCPTPPSDHTHDQESVDKVKKVKKSGSAISRLFSRPSSTKLAERNNKTSKGALSTSEYGIKNGRVDKKAMPTLGQMRKFASGRESLANFDWTAQIAPIDNDRDCFSDEETTRRRDSDDEEEEKEIIIPYSAPMMIGGGVRNLEPRKEVNLWKRRTMDPPPPLAFCQKVRS